MKTISEKEALRLIHCFGANLDEYEVTESTDGSDRIMVSCLVRCSNNQVRVEVGCSPIAGGGPYTNSDDVFICDPASGDKQ